MEQENKTTKTTTDVKTKIGQGISTEVKTLLGVVMIFAVVGIFAFAGMAVKGIVRPKKAVVKNQIVQYQPKKVIEDIEIDYKFLEPDLEEVMSLKKMPKRIRPKKTSVAKNSGVIEVDQEYLDTHGAPLIFGGTTTVMIIEDLVFTNDHSTSTDLIGFDLYDNAYLIGQDHLVSAYSTFTNANNTSMGIFLHDYSQAVACNIQHFGWGFALEDYSKVSSSTAKFNMIAGIELIDNSEASFVISENNYFGFVLSDNSTVLDSYASYNKKDGFYIGGNALIKDNMASYNSRYGYVCASGISLSNIAKKNNMHGFYFDSNAEYNYCIAIGNEDIGMVLGGGQPVVEAEGLFSCYNNMDFLCIDLQVINSDAVLDSYGGGCKFLSPKSCPLQHHSDQPSNY